MNFALSLGRGFSQMQQGASFVYIPADNFVKASYNGGLNVRAHLVIMGARAIWRLNCKQTALFP